MKRGKMILISLGALLLLCFISTHAGVQSLGLRKVADLNTPMPGGSGNLTDIHSPVISGSNIAFWANGSGEQGGIYLFNGSTLSKVIDLNTPIPGGSGNFANFYPPVISGSNVAFLGLSSSSPPGIYLFNGSTLSKVADVNTPIPGGSGNFTHSTARSPTF